MLLGLLRSFNISILVGSAILIGSASYLAEVGMQYYCEEFCRIRKKLLEATGGEGLVLPCPMLMLGGTDDAALVRSVVETNTWFSAVMGELCFVSSTLKEVSRLLSTGGELFFTDPYRIMLPASLSGVPGGRRFVIVGASYADRTGETLIRRGGATVKTVIMLAWRPIRDKIPPMVAWMETAMADEPEDSLVIFQLLDSSMYLARTEEGGLAPA